MMLPTFFIPGAPKCGTTTLDAMLRSHPDVLMSDPKEPASFTTHFNEGDDYRRRRYAAYSGQAAIGDATPHYLGTAEVHDRIADCVPDAEFIVCIREPVARTVSHYEFRVAHGLEARAFSTVVAQGWKPDVIRHSGYHRNLQPFLSRYPLERFHFVQLEHLAAEPQAVYDDVLRFLDLPEIPVGSVHANAARQPANDTVRRALATAQGAGLGHLVPRSLRPAVRRSVRWAVGVARPGHRLTLSARERQQLVALFAPEAEELERLTGLDLKHWRRVWADESQSLS